MANPGTNLTTRPGAVRRTRIPAVLAGLLATLLLAGCGTGAAEGGEHQLGGEANIKLPSLDIVSFHGITGSTLLLIGIGICALGLIFGLLSYSTLAKLPVHKSMREISELIYETCKAYMIQQGKFLLRLWGAIAVVIVLYFAITGSGVFAGATSPNQVPTS